MTPDIDLDALTALEKHTSEVPWEVTPLLNGTKFVVTSGPEAYSVGTCWDRADADLIAAVRNNLPALLSALTATRAELDERQADLDRARSERKWAEEERDSAKRYVDKLCARRDDVLSQRDAARAEADHLRKVLDAANATTEAAQRIVTAALADGTATITAAAPKPGLPFALEVPPHCPRDCKAWCKAYEEGEACPLDAAASQPANCGDSGHVHIGPYCTSVAAAPQPDETYDPIAVLDEAIAASGMRITFDPRHIVAPHTHRGPKATDADREHPAHEGQTCEEYEAAGAGDGEQDTATTAPDRCYLPVQEGKWCGLVICRKDGCRLAPGATTASGQGTAGAQPDVLGPNDCQGCGGLDGTHIYRICGHDPATACLVLVEFGPEPGHSRCCGLPLPCRTHDITPGGEQA